MKRDLTLEEVLELRQQIVLNSLFVSDYRNNMGVDPRAACDFFDGFMCYIEEIAAEEGFVVETMSDYDEFFRRYDTAENLEEWFGCFEDCPLYAEIEDDLEYAA